VDVTCFSGTAGRASHRCVFSSSTRCLGSSMSHLFSTCAGEHHFNITRTISSYLKRGLWNRWISTDENYIDQRLWCHYSTSISIGKCNSFRVKLN
jgi:hypothetical protein